MSNFSVLLTKKAERDLKKVPHYIADKFQFWLDLVENEGLQEARKIKSFHDEPLKGKRHGQRSVRLSKAYRAIYIEKTQGRLELIEVKEVNKHDY
jgi:toxin HigB-1